MESSSSLHVDAVQVNTDVTRSIDEQGSTGVKRSRITRSPIMQYFKLMHDRTYSCEICRQKYPDGMQGVIKRPTDGSTNVFWKHFKAVHRRLYDALKGFGDDHGGQQCIITEGADGQLKIEAPKKRPMGGLTPDETKDVIARFVCLTDSPWSIVDHKAFKELWRYATQIEVDPPSAKVIKSWTTNMYQKMKETIATGFTSVHHVMLTADAWTAENGCGLLGVTAHWIDASWEYRECVLAVRELAGKHDGESMAYILLEIIEEFKLQAKVSLLFFVF